MIVPFNSVEEMLTNKVIDEVNNCTKDTILLVGAPNSGKSKVINTLKEQRNNENIIDATLSYDNYKNIYNDKIYDLYYICLIIDSILDYLKKNFGRDCPHFKLMNKCLLDEINNMYMVGDYSSYDNKYIKYFKDPELLLYRFSDVLFDIFNYNDITLIIDNFDKEGSSSERYQRLIYSTIRNYFKLITTVSDPLVCNNKNKLSKLNKEADIVEVNHSTNIKYVKDVLNYVYVNEYIDLLPNKSIYDILSKEDLNLIISYANGNILDMIQIIKALYDNLIKYPYIDVTLFINNYIDTKNNDLLIYGDLHLKRKLHI